MRYRSIFISDVHLGTPDCQAEYLLGFLQAVRADQIYLVGDIIDLEAMSARAFWPASHAAVIGQLLLMASRGTRIVYIPGNHDASLRGLVGQTISGIDVRLHAVHVAADGRRFRVSHGDEFDSERLGRDWLVWVGEYARQFVCWLNRGFNRVRRRCGLPYLPLPIVAKSRIEAALTYIQDFEQRVSAAAVEGGYDGHICGHIHFGAIREISGVTYMNDGDWVEHCTALTEDDSGQWSLLHWSGTATELMTAGLDGVTSRLPARLPLTSLQAAVRKQAA